MTANPTPINSNSTNRSWATGVKWTCMTPAPIVTLRVQATKNLNLGVALNTGLSDSFSYLYLLSSFGNCPRFPPTSLSPLWCIRLGNSRLPATRFELFFMRDGYLTAPSLGLGFFPLVVDSLL